MKSKLLLSFLILSATAFASDVGYNTDVKEFSSNDNLYSVLKTHEKIMGKLIVEIKSLKTRVATLESINIKKDAKIKQLIKDINTTNSHSVDEQNSNMKYDEEFKKYLKSNRG